MGPTTSKMFSTSVSALRALWLFQSWLNRLKKTASKRYSHVSFFLVFRCKTNRAYICRLKVSRASSTGWQRGLVVTSFPAGRTALCIIMRRHWRSLLNRVGGGKMTDHVRMKGTRWQTVRVKEIRPHLARATKWIHWTWRRLDARNRRLSLECWYQCGMWKRSKIGRLKRGVAQVR